MVLFPWFLATAVGLMWAASARDKKQLPPGVPPGSVKLEPVTPVSPSAPTAPAVNVQIPGLPNIPGMFDTMPIGAGMGPGMGSGSSGLPPIGGGASAPPPRSSGPSAPPPLEVVHGPRFPVTSPGLPTAGPGFGTQPVGGGAPILVSAPPPGSIPIGPPMMGPPMMGPSLPPIKVGAPPPGSVPAAPPTPVTKVTVPPPGTVKIPPPSTPVVTHPDSRAALASEAFRMIMASVPAQTVKDPILLKAYQRQEGLDQTGEYGPGTGKSFMKYGFVPAKPFWWGKSVAANKDDWRGNMLTMARKDPQRRDEWEDAAQV